MAKQKTNKFKNIPRKYLVIGIVSLVINVLVLAAGIIGYVVDKSGHFDYAVVNEGVSRMCSDEFRQTVLKTEQERGTSANDTKQRLALIDFPCERNGSTEYYVKGFKEYTRSLGVQE